MQGMVQWTYDSDKKYLKLGDGAEAMRRGYLQKFFCFSLSNCRRVSVVGQVGGANFLAVFQNETKSWISVWMCAVFFNGLM